MKSDQSLSEYKELATRLDALPNGFPPTQDGAELRLLAALFSPEEAILAARLRLTKETAEAIGQRLGIEAKALREQLKGMARRGLITIGKTDKGLGFGLLPFVVGIYENQIGRLDAELARLFEDYYQKAFKQVLVVEPAVHRIIPVNESVRMDMEIRPFESATEIIAAAQAWGVQDCICRKQKELIGDPCEHPVEVCMVFGPRPGVFDDHPVIRSLSQEEAMATLSRAAAAGLVHSVSNNQQGLYYICNCCTCSCGILRGMAELGMANVVARSAFVNQVEEELCIGCELCLDYCQFDALSLTDEFFAKVDEMRCVGCGVCVPSCTENALALVSRPTDEVKPIPVTVAEWGIERAMARGLDMKKVL
jgi:electron transport complex protein RnfB